MEIDIISSFIKRFVIDSITEKNHNNHQLPVRMIYFWDAANHKRHAIDYLWSRKIEWNLCHYKISTPPAAALQKTYGARTISSNCSGKNHLRINALLLIYIFSTLFMTMIIGTSNARLMVWMNGRLEWRQASERAIQRERKREKNVYICEKSVERFIVEEYIFVSFPRIRRPRQKSVKKKILLMLMCFA
jgi:hypothetical protein